MHNFLAVDGRWLDAPHSGDHLGRAVWALCEVGSRRRPPSPGASLRLLGEVAACRPTLTAARSMAVALLGLTRLPGGRSGLRSALAGRAGRRPDVALRRAPVGRVALVRGHARPMTTRGCPRPCSPPQPPARLGHAGRRPGGARVVLHQCALDSDAVVLVGNRWRHGCCRGNEAGPGRQWPADGGGLARVADEGDEQPLDAAALVEALRRGVSASPAGDAHGARRCAPSSGSSAATGSGDRSTTSPPAAATTGSAAAGLNDNEGAESTLAYFQALLALESAGRSLQCARVADGEGRACSGPIAWRTPPEHYGPWEQVTGLLAEGWSRAAST